METLVSIFREVHDPRDFNARHDLPAMLFIALAATLCGAKSCVDIADFAAAHEDELAGIVISIPVLVKRSADLFGAQLRHRHKPVHLAGAAVHLVWPNRPSVTVLAAPKAKRAPAAAYQAEAGAQFRVSATLRCAGPSFPIRPALSCGAI
jgi:hypothetical protein